MCGIVAIISNSESQQEVSVSERLVDALKRLEYRGYDSAGVATLLGNGEIDRRRAVLVIRQPDVILVAFRIENEDRALLWGRKLHERFHSHRRAKRPWRHGPKDRIEKMN